MAAPTHARVLAALRARGTATTPELAAALPDANRSTVATALRVLAELGDVRPAGERPGPGRGRPAKVWEYAGPTA